jgi:hypothetical protein
MKNKALEAQLDGLLKEFPKEQVLAYYPRHIVTPMAYLDPKYFSVLNFRFIHNQLLTGTTPTPQNQEDTQECETFSAVLVEKMVPTYFLAEEFLESVDQTDFLESFTFSQLHFPMPGFLLVLPDQFTAPRVSLNVPFVMVSTYEGLLYIHPFAVNDAGNFARVSTTIRFEGVQESIQASIERGEAYQSEDKSDEYKYNVYIFGLVLKLLIIISTKPHALVDSLDQPPARKQRTRKNGTIKTDALWNATFIGKGYSAQRIGAGGGSGPGKRMHWRRGHLRNQRYGENRSLVKVVWIEPVLIHGELQSAGVPPVDAD